MNSDFYILPRCPASASTVCTEDNWAVFSRGGHSLTCSNPPQRGPWRCLLHLRVQRFAVTPRYDSSVLLLITGDNSPPPLRRIPGVACKCKAIFMKSPGSDRFKREAHRNLLRGCTVVKEIRFSAVVISSRQNFSDLHFLKKSKGKVKINFVHSLNNRNNVEGNMVCTYYRCGLRQVF